MPLAYLGELHYHHVVDPRRLVAAGLRARRDLEDEMMFDLIKYTLYKLHLTFFIFKSPLFSWQQVAAKRWAVQLHSQTFWRELRGCRKGSRAKMASRGDVHGGSVWHFFACRSLGIN